MSGVAKRPRPKGAALDLHEGISTPTSRSCPRWPSSLALLSGSGVRVSGRCKATNLRDYCARLYAVETCEMLGVDAEHDPPSLLVVLTTRTADMNPATFTRAREKLIQERRRRFPDLEYACIVEFTTGYGPRSGGVRRPHSEPLAERRYGRSAERGSGRCRFGLVWAR